MRVHYLQHVPFEGLGSMEPWLISRGATLSCSRLYERPTLPDPNELDLLIVMGGPMSVNDEAQHPWLVAEKRFVRQVIEAGKPVLGVCLGAQLIASAMGARVYKNHEPEIGWWPIQALPTEDDTFAFPLESTVFHWHGETFDLPPGAVHLARSEACAHQAFQLGERVLGLQFHLETTPETAAALVANCADELVDAPWIQDANSLLATPVERYNSINALSAKLLTYLLRDWPDC